MGCNSEYGGARCETCPIGQLSKSDQKIFGRDAANAADVASTHTDDNNDTPAQPFTNPDVPLEVHNFAKMFTFFDQTQAFFPGEQAHRLASTAMRCANIQRGKNNPSV